jgi:hypothetical protein
MKPILACILVIILANILTVSAQRVVTIKVEDLKKPTALLEASTYQDILENMIWSDSSKAGAFREPHKEPSFNIVAKSNMPEDMIDRGYHPFFEGMYQAYADHRPFTLSPDMIWLLICQGFSQHVNNNSDSLRKLFVDFSGKMSLVVISTQITLDNPNSSWKDVFPEFMEKINAAVGKNLTNTLTADFSTTTDVSKIASQITLMDAMKSYFDFIVIYMSCGIPQVTIEGTPEDWQKVLDKTEALRQYKLDWWVDSMEPVLKKILAASKGEIDKPFWQTMFKYHQKNSCGAPRIVDGWIVKFFPYNKDGNRTNLDSLSTAHDGLPNELVKVDLEYDKVLPSGAIEKTPLELWAGFMGLTQDSSTFALKPEIGWMIRKKGNGASSKRLNELKKANDSRSTNTLPSLQGIVIRVKKIPGELLEIPHIFSLNVFFADAIVIPDDMQKIKIDRFEMSGNIDKTGIARICKMFPDTQLIINNIPYVNGVAGEAVR